MANVYRLREIFYSKVGLDQAMHAAFILIEVKAGKAWSVASEASRIEYVRATHVVTGPYDVIVYLEAEEPLVDAIKRVVERIQGIEGVEKTVTAIAIH